MSRDGLDPLGPELESLLQAERLAPSPSESLDRVWARVTVSLAGGGASGQGGHGGATRAVTSGAWLGRHARAAVIAAFALGCASGAALVVALRPAAPGRVVYLEKSMAGRSGQAEEIARAAPPAEPTSPTAIVPSASVAVSLQPVPLPPTRCVPIGLGELGVARCRAFAARPSSHRAIRRRHGPSAGVDRHSRPALRAPAAR
jgi:hypothetical protein